MRHCAGGRDERHLATVLIIAFHTRVLEDC